MTLTFLMLSVIMRPNEHHHVFTGVSFSHCFCIIIEI